MGAILPKPCQLKGSVILVAALTAFCWSSAARADSVHAMRVAVYDARGTRSTRTDAGLLEPSASSPLTLDNVPLAPLKLQLSFPHSVQSRLLRPASLPMLRMPTSFKRISRDSAPETAADDHGRSATSYWDYPSDSFKGIKLFGGGNPPGSLP
ncbi:MAG TPA: hypothetical protein VKP30_23235, partial [Polyangiaceae bacterium]|nr:hypothetical protein [Polyangiaceae bacterium]